MKTITFKDTDEVFSIMAEDKRYIIASRPYTVSENKKERIKWTENLSEFLSDCLPEESISLTTEFIQNNGRPEVAIDRDTFCYTIIDLQEQIRSSDNYSCKFDYDKKEECIKALAELNSGTMELSRRNKVELQIKQPHTIKICNECCERMDFPYQDCYCNSGKIIEIEKKQTKEPYIPAFEVEA